MACNKCGRPLSESHRPQPVALGCEPKQSRPNRVTPEPSVIRGCGKVVRPLCEFGTGAVEPRNPQHGPQSPIRPGFAGVYTPAFVVRLGGLIDLVQKQEFRRGLHPGLRCAQTSAEVLHTPQSGFAGVYTPAFVVRFPPVCTCQCECTVSPGFTPRPSLCGGLTQRDAGMTHRFAGVYTPAFVVRSPR